MITMTTNCECGQTRVRTVVICAGCAHDREAREREAAECPQVLEPAETVQALRAQLSQACYERDKAVKLTEETKNTLRIAHQKRDELQSVVENSRVYGEFAQQQLANAKRLGDAMANAIPDTGDLWRLEAAIDAWWAWRKENP